MENFVDVGGAILWTCSEGVEGGAAILLCNGGPGYGDCLAPVSRMLEKKYRVIRFEQRGCGRSGREGPYDLAVVIEDMERIRAYYEIENWVVGGHSWGANVALVYAMAHPQRTQALLYIAGNGIQNDRNWLAEYQRNLAERGETLPPIELSFNEEVNKHGNASLWAYGREADFYARIAILDLPALFVMGGCDIRPSWPAEQLSALIPSSSYVSIDGAEHFIWLQEPAALQNTLMSFLHKNRI